MKPVFLDFAQPGPGSTGPAARRAMLVPVVLVLGIALVVVLALPGPLPHRPVLAACVASGGGLIGLEYLVPWHRIPSTAYLPVAVLGVLVIGLGMWASGGASSPFAAFVILPLVYAAAATGAVLAAPVAVVGGLVTASPALYTPRGHFVLTALAAVGAYLVVVFMVGIIMDYLHYSDESAAAEAQMRAQSEAHAGDLLALQRVFGIVSTHLSLDEAIDAIVRELASTFGHSLISIYFRDGDRLVMGAQRGYDFYYEVIELGQGVIGTAAVEDRTIYLPDVRANSNYREATTDVIGEIAVPLRDQGEVAGVLNIESRETLTTRDRDLLELFGAQVSVVLRNARQAGELRQRAERDSLTGLLNHRTVMEDIERTLREMDSRCALLVIDVDDFKHCNDTHGHLVGDAILRRIAAILRECCRQQDHIARYGGDEFVVVLPLAGQSQAEAVAERIRATAVRSPYCTDAGVEVLLSLSIGVAVAPDHATSRQELLDRADHAMYADKRQRTAHRALPDR